MDNNKYPKIVKFESWYILIYSAIFFVLINVGAGILLRSSLAVELRFGSPASYQEIISAVQRIKNDSRKKVVFIGGSVLWGGRGIAEPNQAVPLVFRKYLKNDVGVYNLAMVSAKPLDEFIIAWMLKDSVDLVVVDVNTAFLGDSYSRGIAEDYTKYNRIHSLLTANVKGIFRDNPEIEKCLSSYKIKPVQDYSLSWIDRLPLFKYKDQINYRLFGKHFSLFFETLVSGAIDLVKTGGKQTDWADLFKPIADPNDQVPATVAIQTPPEILGSTLNSCILQAFSTYREKFNQPIVFYVSPHSPAVTKLERQDPVYDKNLNFVSGLFASSSAGFLNLDQSNITPVAAEGYSDEVHLNVAGHEQLADYLRGLVVKMPIYSELFK